MSVILGIDPALSTGWAIITGEGLVACGSIDVDPHSLKVFDHPVYQPDIVIFEHPQIYSPDKAKGDPNQLAGMIFQVGRWWQYYGSTYGAKLRWVYPAEWKGQLSKDICADRIYNDILSPKEQSVCDAGGRGLHKKPLLDMMDAIGIALYAAGRKLKFAAPGPKGRSR